MQSCLLDPEFGYYTSKEVFNKQGDFITSPEISQLFGEMLGIWVSMFLQNNNLVDDGYRLVEFGPGTGELMCDIIRILAQLNLLNGLEISFIEGSKKLRQRQQDKLIQLFSSYDIGLAFNNEKAKNTGINEFYSSKGDKGTKLKWFSSFDEYSNYNFGNLSLSLSSKEREIFLAHEFFDALPVKIFEHSKQRGWCEKLVTQSIVPGRHFDFILSEGGNESVKEYLKPEKTFKGIEIEEGATYELSPKSFQIIGAISQILDSIPGAALIMDYGENQAFSNSLRGIYQHKYVPNERILDLPGEMDLSAYVNFSAFKGVAEKFDNIVATEAIPQGFFLEAMGINVRLDILKNSTDDKKEQDLLQSQRDRIVLAEEMGEIYKFMYIGNKRYGITYPFNFDEEKMEFT